MRTDPRDLIEGAARLPSFPIVFTRLNQAVEDPRSSLADIGKIISEDSSLSARLLRFANSALFCFPSEVDTVTRALTVIGMKQLRDVALATTITEVFHGVPQHMADMGSFWRHSVATGVAARILATYRGEKSLERYFVAGLMHDIGSLVLYTERSVQARAAILRCRTSGELLHRVEAEEIGCDHAAVGAALIARWGLPSSLQEAVACHHAPMRARKHPVEAAVVHLADVIAHVMQYGTNGERFVPPLDPRAWERTGLSPSVLSPVLEQLERQYAEAIRIIIPEAVV